METFEYRKIDAFTTDASLGNPAACLYLEPGQALTESDMLNIAKQHKGFVSEVVYCARKPQAGFELTYYSSEGEVDFCGHGTIACMYGLIKETADLQMQKEIMIHTGKKGALTVYNEIETQDAIYITAPIPQYLGTEVDINEIAENLSINVDQIANTQPIDVIDAGLRTLIVPIGTLSDEIRVFPDERILKGFCLKHGIDIVLIYTLETEHAHHIAHTRVFAPKFGYLEDPATGSGNSAFGYYMLNNHLWNGAPVTVEQGGMDRVFNSISLLYRENRLLFGGRATTRIKGVYYL